MVVRQKQGESRREGFHLNLLVMFERWTDPGQEKWTGMFLTPARSPGEANPVRARWMHITNTFPGISQSETSSLPGLTVPAVGLLR